MKFLLSILGLVALASCSQVETKDKSKKLSEPVPIVSESASFDLQDTTIQFLWRDMKYDSALNDSINSIFINQDYIQSITNPEKAALGYVATFIGNECWWDGEANKDRSNLDCKVITALGLGYQCSDEHLGFLRKWFSTDKQVLSELEKSSCPTTPYTATIQDTFDEIALRTKGDSIIVKFRASAVNIREQESLEWSETDYFVLNDQQLRLVKKEKSEVAHKEF